MQSLLAYWKPRTADYEIARQSLLDHSASKQFQRIDVDDHVWVVTVRNGKLFLLGRIIVGQVTDQAGAVQLMGTHDLWKASHHIVAALGTAEQIRNVSISSLAGSLRFDSDRDRLSVSDGLVNAQQLQTMRVLTADSAAKLEAAMRRAV